MSVCGTDKLVHMSKSFSCQHCHSNQVQKDPFISRRFSYLDGHNHEPAATNMPHTPERKQDQYGNINPLSIAYATRLGLGPTNPGTITVAQETLLFRWTGFSPVLKLLIPAFSLDSAPQESHNPASLPYQRSSTTH